MVIVIIVESEKGWIVQVPLRVVRVFRNRNMNFVHRIDMSAHSVFIFLGHVNSANHVTVLILNELFLV